MDYGLIGNGQSCALVSKEGSIDWCCLPDFDSGSTFARVLDDEKGGYFSIEPADGKAAIAETHQCYERNTNVLLTTITLHNGDAYRITDFMPRWELSRGPSVHAPAHLYRYVEQVSGEPRLRVFFRPQLHYGLQPTTVDVINEDTIKASSHGKDWESGHEQDFYVFLTTSIPAQTVAAGEPFTLEGSGFFVLSYAQPVLNLLHGTVIKHLERTIDHWQRWIKHTNVPPQYQSEVIRSALTLKMLVYEPTGAIVASPTASLPEVRGDVRNWDYRYCWIRDSYFAVNALLKLAKFEETERYVEFLHRLITENLTYLRPLYTIHGDIVPHEKYLDHWSGFANSQPIRIGNNATDHHQTDAYGEVLLTMQPLFMDERIVCRDCDWLWHAAHQMTLMAIEMFDEPDNGIWEIANPPRHYTFSKLLCWAGLDAAVKIAQSQDRMTEYRDWKKQRDRMKDDILEKAWNEDKQAFTQYYGGTALDASTLLMPVLGFIDAKDPRMISTVLKSEEELSNDGLMMRYTNDDDYGKPKNAFTLCTFWLIDALILGGQKRKARKYFEQLLEYGNHVGLFSEHINPRGDFQTGNFPQAYTHVAIINTAMLLS